MSENEIKISSEEYENLLGLLSFDNDATERWIPEPFMKFKEELRPIFTLKPLNTKQREHFTKLMIKIDNSVHSNNNGIDVSSDIVKINNEAMDVASNAVVDIENFIILGTTNKVKEFEKISGHIKADDLINMSELIKRLILERVQTISGFTRSIKASL